MSIPEAHFLCPIPAFPQDLDSSHLDVLKGLENLALLRNMGQEPRLIMWLVLFIPIWICHPCHPYTFCLFLDIFVFKVSLIKLPESLGIMQHIYFNNMKYK